MAVDDRMTSLQSDMIEWRRPLYARPETAFEENATSAYVANVLTSLGYPTLLVSPGPGSWQPFKAAQSRFGRN
jgi:metal-dependent amidase/aminoacylase/carboxypeptidase family protein